MKLYKRLNKYALILFCLFFFVATIQTGAAIYFSKSDAKIQSADLVVVFPGDSQSFEAGIRRVKDCLAKHFMGISTTQGDFRNLLKKKAVFATVSPLPGGKSRSTFEDVYQTSKTLK